MNAIKGTANTFYNAKTLRDVARFNSQKAMMNAQRNLLTSAVMPQGYGMGANFGVSPFMPGAY